jgi:hypothetical protein
MNPDFVSEFEQFSTQVAENSPDHFAYFQTLKTDPTKYLLLAQLLAVDLSPKATRNLANLLWDLFTFKWTAFTE